MTGALVRSQAISNDQAFGSRSVYVGDLPVGFYTLTLKSGNSRSVSKFSKIK